MSKFIRSLKQFLDNFSVVNSLSPSAKRAQREYGLIGIPAFLCFGVSVLIVANLYMDETPVSLWSYVIVLSPLLFLFIWLWSLLTFWRAQDELQVKIMKDGILIGLISAVFMGLAWGLLTMFETISAPNVGIFMLYFLCVVMLGPAVTQLRHRVKWGQEE